MDIEPTLNDQTEHLRPALGNRSEAAIQMREWSLLRGLWQRAAGRGAPAPSIPHGYLETKALYSLGIAIDDALQFLYRAQPSLEAFNAWLVAHARVDAPQAALPENVLSAADLDFWEEHGYLVLRGAVPPQQCAATRSAIWEFLGASPDDAASWYRPHPAKSGLMLQFSDHPALAANRCSARIRQAYEQLYGSAAIFKSIDKVSFNPPETVHHGFLGSPPHWDVSLRLPIPFKLQGLLYLGDCGARDGAFHCMSGFHKRIAQWLDEVPDGRRPRDWAALTLKPDAIPGQAGDFIIWHQALPHCASPNHGRAPRMVQYLTYLPDSCNDQDDWI